MSIQFVVHFVTTNEEVVMPSLKHAYHLIDGWAKNDGCPLSHEEIDPDEDMIIFCNEDLCTIASVRIEESK